MPREEKGVVAIFRNHTVKNEGKSIEAGRPIFDDMEVVEMRFAGSKTVSVFPASSFSHWEENEESGEQHPITYAERFPRQYQQFRSKEHQTKAGTPLDYLPFLTDGKRAELRALNIYTAEALSVVEGQELKNLGPGGRDWKNQAIAFLEEGSEHSRILKLEAEVDSLKARNQVLEDDADLRRKDPRIAEYEAMSDAQLRDHIKVLTGVDPKGNIPRKTLIRMAEDHKAKAAA
jgi:hypothetical protein